MSFPLKAIPAGSTSSLKAPLARQASMLRPYFTRSLAMKAIGTFFIVLILLQLINYDHTLPFLWIIIASLTAILFFRYLYLLSREWTRYPDAIFRKKLFKYALLIRVLVVLFLYILFVVINGKPFEFYSADSSFYDFEGGYLADYILKGDLNYFNKLPNNVDISDLGMPVYASIVYALLFKSTIMFRMVNAVLGAATCVIVYNIARRNFNERVGRIAAIMMLLLPDLIYYCGLTLKESVMIFLFVSCINYTDKVLRTRKIRSRDFLLMLLTGAALFFFRTILALTAILSAAITIVILSGRISSRGRRAFLGFWVIVGTVAIFYTSLGDTIEKLMQQSSTNQAAQMNFFSKRKGGNTLAKYGSKALFLPIILIAPLPTFIDTKQDNQEMLSGAMFTKNIYAFFVILALVVLYKRKLLRKHAMMLTPLFVYLSILAASGFALSERFHTPAMPFLAILASYGITQVNRRNIRAYIPYLIVVSLLIIGWNWFKLAGRA